VSDGSWDWASAVQTAMAAGRPVALVTVVRCEGSTPRAVGAKMLVDVNGLFAGSIGGGALEERAIAEAKACLASGQSKLVHVALGPELGQCCGGAVDVFCETVGGGPELYIFGAGHVARHVVAVLEGTPFRLHLVDERDDWLNAQEVSARVARHVSWEDVASMTAWSDQTSYVAVMTHSHQLDEDIVRALIDKPVRYLGLIGSATKWARIKKRLLARGADVAAAERVRCPIGVDIGGKSPREVAISVAAELVALANRK